VSTAFAPQRRFLRGSLDFSLRIFMIIKMRTTVVLHDALFREAKSKAAARGISLSDLVAEALQALLVPAPAPRSAFRMMTFGSAKKKHVSPAAMSDAAADEEG
jgi:predicted DNA-binding ribbon-helix-helix protein